jgi:hypothetical protein
MSYTDVRGKENLPNKGFVSISDAERECAIGAGGVMRAGMA